jgi:hypothetical protein
MAEALPSWSVHISGHSATSTAAGPARSARRACATTTKLIGVGKGESLPRAVAAAMLKTIQLRARSG